MTRAAQTKALDADSYEFDPKMSMTDRVAHYLDWAALHFPKQYTPYNHLLKAVMGFSRTPQLKSEDVERLRSSMSAVRQKLLKTYQRELDSQPSIGVRATTDDADVAVVVLPKKMRRLKSAKDAVVKTTLIIDPARIPNTPEFAIVKRWLTTDVKTLMKTLNSPEFETKLLPPKSTSGETPE